MNQSLKIQTIVTNFQPCENEDLGYFRKDPIIMEDQSEESKDFWEKLLINYDVYNLTQHALPRGIEDIRGKIEDEDDFDEIFCCVEKINPKKFFYFGIQSLVS